MKRRIAKEPGLLKDKLAVLQQQKLPFEIFSQQEIPILENFLEFYMKSNGSIRKMIPGCIFYEKLDV
jgi:hypothetical protein